MYVDLHIHTSASDGTWGDVQLIEKLREKNITMFSITDHDELVNSTKMIEYSKQFPDLKYINGVEVTCDYHAREYHLTVYQFDYNNIELRELLDFNREVRESFDEMFIKLIDNPKLDAEEYANYTYHKNEGGFKLVHYLIEKGIVKDIKDYYAWFNKNLTERGLEKKFNPPKEVMKICKAAGGKVFLAHPSYYYRGSHMPVEELDDWRALGIDGIECYSPYSKAEHYDFYVDYCNRNNLLISGGSDCHGDYMPERELGHPKVTWEMLRLGFEN